MMLPKIISLRKVRSKQKAPSKIENTKKAIIVKNKPIKKPLRSPISLCFFIPIKTPKKMLTPLMTWLTGAMILSEMFVNLNMNAKSKIPTKATQRPTTTPFKTLKKRPLVAPFSLFAVFNFIIASLPFFKHGQTF